MSTRQSTKSILIVDDQELFRESVVEAARSYNPAWKLRSAENGEMALALLLEEEADLLVTDLEMPVLDGFQLLAAIRKHHMRPPVIVVSGHATPENQAQLTQLGSLVCIAKPVNLTELFKCFERALASPRSVVDGLTLPGFCQLLEIEQHTCLLRAWLGERVADLVFRDGVLIDARLGKSSGRAAALEILTWRQAHLEVLPAVDLERRSIRDTLQWLLLEAARGLDESRIEPPPSAPPPAKRAPYNEASGSFAALNFDTLEIPAPGAAAAAKSFATLEIPVGPAAQHDGVFGAALIELESGAVLASFGRAEAGEAGAAIGNAEMIRLQLAWLGEVDPTHQLEDIAMILTSEVQIIRPLEGSPGVFAIAAFDRSLVSLASARLQMAGIEESLLALQSR